MIVWPAQARVRDSSLITQQSKTIFLNGFPHGLNTALPAFQIATTEMARCVNWKINKGGLETRPAVVRYTDTSIGVPKSIADVPIGSTTYQLVSDADYKLYYINGTTPVLIGTLKGEAEIIAYNGYAVLLDGSYIKYLDDSLTIKIAYDDGTGTSGYQFDKSSGENSGSFQLGNGVNSKVAQLFRTQNWDSGYTIPPTTVSAYLAKEGRPTGSINVVIREADVDDLTVLGNAIATTEFIADASELTGAAIKYSVTFTEDDITTEMSPETNYYCSVEFDNSDGDVKNLTAISKANPGVVDCVNHGYSVGDVVAFFDLTEMTELNGTSQTVSAVIDDDHFAINDTSGYSSAETTGGDCVQKKASDNYVYVYYSTVTSGGSAYHYDGWWYTDSTKDCLMSLRPGKPPKASFGAVLDGRIFVAGDPDNPGYVWFGNLSQLDWSTPDGGGYVGANDEDSNNFPVGGLAVLFKNLYVYGKESQPYLSQLVGSSPSAYVISQLYQKAWTLPKTIQNTVNDLWVANRNGVDTLSGVQEYGDVRTFSYSDPVEDRIVDYWSDSAIAGYYPKDGQYWLYMPGHHRVLVFNTKNPVQNIAETGLRYPCSEYEFCKGLYSTSTYKWTKSDNGTNEYYCELAAGGNPSISDQPDYITLDNKKITEGIVGSLEDHQWDYGDNDGLGYNTVYIRDESGDPDTTGVIIRNVLVPTCFGVLNNEFMFGGTDGYIYKVDDSEYKDLTTEKIYFDIVSPYFMFPMSHSNLDKYQINLFSKGGASVDISFYKDEFQGTAEYTLTKILVPDDRLTIDDMIMDVEDAMFLVDTTSTRKENPLWEDVNINARSIQIRIHNIILAGYPLYLNEQIIRYRGLSY